MSILYKILLSAALITAGSCDSLRAEFSDWSDSNKTLYKTYLSLQVMDTMQTMDMIHCQQIDPNCRLKEANPFLNPEPTTADLLIMKGLLNYGAYRILDNRLNDKQRKIAITLMVLTSIATVHGNHENGLSFKIRF